MIEFIMVIKTITKSNSFQLHFKCNTQKNTIENFFFKTYLLETKLKYAYNSVSIHTRITKLYLEILIFSINLNNIQTLLIGRSHHLAMFYL